MIAERFCSKTVAYEHRFDRKEGLKPSYLSRQLDTFLGERLNVLLSQNQYEIKNNSMYGEDMNEQFSDVIRRGIAYSREVDGEERLDKKREEAELEGFLKTQEILCNPKTKIGTMMLSVSLKGDRDSRYQHNFYDIFTLKENQGKRFIEARRYSSALTIAEYKDKLGPLSFVGDIFSDADFLGHPIKIDNVFFENADQIHSYLHKDHKTMELEEFNRIIVTCERLKQEYIKNPTPETLDAISNKADVQAGFVELKPNKFYDPLIGSSKPLTVGQEINLYGNQPVRVVATGCGSSGSTSTNSLDKKSSPFSVSEFGSNGDKMDYEFDQDGPCKKCNAISVKCGPCGICKACDLSIRASNKSGRN